MKISSMTGILASATPRILLSFSFVISSRSIAYTTPFSHSEISRRDRQQNLSWLYKRNYSSSHSEMEANTYDVAVIGGGPGGLAASKEAARLGRKTVVFDYVKPSPRGSTWGLGGTCVNVGCIPKKIMHYASLLGHSQHDSVELGWAPSPATHNWNKLVETVQNYIKMLNFSYRSGLMMNNVTYINAYAKLIDKNTIEYTDKKGTQQIRATDVIIAVGERPTVPDDVKGAKDYAITSDDLFQLKKSPGKTLLVGGSFVALECAGLLTGLGYDVTVSVRSVLLRGFDRQCAEKVGELMEATGTKFIYKALPQEVKKLADGRLEVTFTNDHIDTFDTVIYATGRMPESTYQELRDIGVESNKYGNIKAVDGKTSVDGIYAVGDIVEGIPALAPVAIKDGELLARRLYGKSTKKLELEYVPLCIYTPFEYGTCGLSEEEALVCFLVIIGQMRQKRYDDIEVYLSEFTTLELSAVHRNKAEVARADEDDIYMPPTCLTKVICRRDGTIVGIHFVGPNAGEIIQGLAVAVRLGAKKQDLDDTIGVHPTDAESFMGLRVTKASGESWVAAGGCGGGRCG
ncbi:Hg-II reductase MerA like protein [Babesia gibsoni]|uniref:Hg-II reductase MerA like protein n=1 Tax=Babesia gibsoni TaxID=33632 RepID=A0AAD8LP20_BABGI|nr:Hg-II reductase MerA like protein [Babesia gibsoni]